MLFESTECAFYLIITLRTGFFKCFGEFLWKNELTKSVKSAKIHDCRRMENKRASVTSQARSVAARKRIKE